MFAKKVRLIDIARVIERDKSTIIRWEELGLIPAASRDSRGWRFYSEDEAHAIVEKVRSTHYFKDVSDAPSADMKVRPQRMVYIGVMVGVVLLSYQLLLVISQADIAVAAENILTINSTMQL